MMTLHSLFLDFPLETTVVFSASSHGALASMRYR